MPWLSSCVDHSSTYITHSASLFLLCHFSGKRSVVLMSITHQSGLTRYAMSWITAKIIGWGQTGCRETQLRSSGQFIRVEKKSHRTGKLQLPSCLEGRTRRRGQGCAAGGWERGAGSREVGHLAASSTQWEGKLKMRKTKVLVREFKGRSRLWPA